MSVNKHTHTHKERGRHRTSTTRKWKRTHKSKSWEPRRFNYIAVNTQFTLEQWIVRLFLLVSVWPFKHKCHKSSSCYCTQFSQLHKTIFSPTVFSRALRVSQSCDQLWPVSFSLLLGSVWNERRSAHKGNHTWRQRARERQKHLDRLTNIDGGRVRVINTLRKNVCLTADVCLVWIRLFVCFYCFISLNFINVWAAQLSSVCVCLLE